MEKIAANRARDARKEASMRDLGFRVAVVWQCELREPFVLQRRLQRFVHASVTQEARRVRSSKS